MGTNYYTRVNECKYCNRFEEIHLGKSSFGWKFCFNLNGKKYYSDFEELKDFIKNKVIKDEYGNEIDYDSFIDLIEEKQNDKNTQKDYGAIDISGYVFDDCEFS